MPGYHTPAPGGGGSNVTAVSVSQTPDGGTPTSTADGATLDATAFVGFEVQDPSSLLVSLTDDGSDTVVTPKLGGSEMSSANALIADVGFFWPAEIMGDFELAVRMRSDSGATNRQIGLVVGTGDTTNECGMTCLRYGRWNATTAQAKLYANSNASTANTGAASYFWTSDHWYRLKRVGQVISTAHGGTGAEPSWEADFTSNKWDRSGGAARVGVLFYSPTATTGDAFQITDVRLTASEYTATP